MSTIAKVTNDWSTETILTGECRPLYLSFLECIALVIQTQRQSGKACERFIKHS